MFFYPLVIGGWRSETEGASKQSGMSSESLEDVGTVRFIRTQMTSISIGTDTQVSRKRHVKISVSMSGVANCHSIWVVWYLRYRILNVWTKCRTHCITLHILCSYILYIYIYTVITIQWLAWWKVIRLLSSVEKTMFLDYSIGGPAVCFLECITTADNMVYHMFVC